MLANERGVYAFGQDSDMIKFGPKSQLTAIIENWGPYYIDRVQLALDKKWASSDFWGGLSTKLVHMAPYTNMPDDVRSSSPLISRASDMMATPSTTMTRVLCWRT